MEILLPGSDGELLGVTRHILEITRWHPHRLNEFIGCHWRKMARMKREDAEIISAYALQQGIPKAAGKRRVRLHLTLGPRQRSGDNDAYWKSLLDGLVRAGLLVDDSRQWCELTDPTFGRGTECRTTITLEEIS